MHGMPAEGPTRDAFPRVVVIGCGRWGQHAVRDLVSLGCAVIVVDVSEAGCAKGIELGAAASFATLAHATERFDVDGIVITAPTTLHASLSLDALALGVPVFVEKPLADDPALAQAMVDAGGDRLFVMHKWHYHPGIEALAELAASGRLGDINGVTSERTGPAQPSDDTDVVWLLAPHEITIGQRILGSFPMSTTAVADVTTGGVVGVDVISRWDDGRWHRWSVSVRSSQQRRHVVLHGSAGYATLADPYVAHIDVHFDGRPGGSAASHERIAISQEFPLIRELRQFCDHLAGGPQPPTPGRHGLAVVQIISSLRTAADLPAVGSLLASDATRTV